MNRKIASVLLYTQGNLVHLKFFTWFFHMNFIWISREIHVKFHVNFTWKCSREFHVAARLSWISREPNLPVYVLYDCFGDGKERQKWRAEGRCLPLSSFFTLCQNTVYNLRQRTFILSIYIQKQENIRRNKDSEPTYIRCVCIKLTQVNIMLYRCIDMSGYTMKRIMFNGSR